MTSTLFAEIEKLTGRSREVCFYTGITVLVLITFIHDPIGALTTFMTLMVPAFYTILSLLNEQSEPTNFSDRRPSFTDKEFVLRYWLIYGVFVTIEQMFGSFIHFDLRVIRLVALSLCLSTRVPILMWVSSRIELQFCKALAKFDENNYQLVLVPQK
ncbi:unnamed protein product [Caenorhabditis bovis]|uniref:Receptor expression-enhancing protein n=1 Tax=Caenorhabditis bovis TaxID=2654633 RepID=A0A8S1EZE2_9PELO|nr:unnamed protein product [Caenorhabditis bovis]